MEIFLESPDVNSEHWKGLCLKTVTGKESFFGSTTPLLGAVLFAFLRGHYGR